MGIIRKQSIRGSIIAYIGVALGFVTVGLLWPRYLATEEIGLLSVVLAIATILAHIGSLGFGNAINRYFPLFRDKKKQHQGFVFLMLAVTLIGALVSLLLVYALKDFFIEQNSAKSALLGRYYYFIIPVFIALLFYNILDTYLKMLYDAVTGILLKELVLRIMFLVLLLAYIVFGFHFSRFILFYSIAYFLPLIIIIAVLVIRGEFSLRPGREILTKDLVKKLVNISMYGVVGGFGLIAISNIDRIMINKMLDLHETGVYTIAFLYGSIIILPGRIIGKSATALISEGWKRNDIKLIDTIYSKTCVNQFIFALFVFMLLWLNINHILKIIPPVYSAGKYVIFFIAIAYVIDMSTGTNGIILVTSKYYRFHAYFVFFLLIVIVATNLVFIPIWGIVGAAVASAISTMLNNAARYIFLYSKFRMQPFNYRYIIVAAGTLIIYFTFKQIRIESNNVYLDILITTVCSSILFGILIYLSGASGDINERIRVYWQIVKDLANSIRGRK